MAKDKKAQLFREFYYGMPKKNVVEMTHAAVCDDAKNNLVLCAPDLISFLQEKWEQIFYFNNLGELQQIILGINSGDSARFSNIQQRLKDNGWVPVFMESDSDALDLLADKSPNGHDELENSLNDFQKQALSESGNLTIYFFPAAYCAELNKKKNNISYSQAVDEAAENFVMLSLMLTPDNLKIAFTAPLLSRKNALRYGQMIKK